jgi:hypothetical protein
MRLLLTQSDRLTMLTSYELIYEEDALVAVPFGPIDPVPCFGLTMRNDWLPTQLQANFIDLIQKRIVGALTPMQALQRPATVKAKKAAGVK